MAQFDLHRLPGGIMVVDLQSDLVAVPATRIVAPVLPLAAAEDLRGLTPRVSLDGTPHVVAIPELTALRAAALGRPVGSLAEHRDALFRALDVLTHGF